MERMKVNEYYDNPQQFLDEISKINVRKLVNQSDKDLIKNLKNGLKNIGKKMGQCFYMKANIKDYK